MKKLISTKELAEYLNVKPLTIWRKVQSGEIPYVKIGNRLRFDKQKVDKWLQEKVRRVAQILVVDDEPVVGDFIKNALDGSRYQVMIVLSSLEALEIIKQKRFDLIFLDLVMPELDGAEVFKYIKERDKDVPVIIISGYPDSEIMTRAMEHGPFLVLKKPLMIDDIITTVHNQL
ncbi:response regulator [Chloroflexota bacterium]